MRQRRKGLSAIALVLITCAAIAINFLLGLAAQQLMRMVEQSASEVGGSSIMEVALLPERAPKPDEPEPKKLEELERGELVQNHEIVREEQPEDAKRISEFDNDVDKETRARSGRPEIGAGSVRQPARDGERSAEAGEQQPESQPTDERPQKERAGDRGTSPDAPEVPIRDIARAPRDARDGELAPGEGAPTGLLTPRASGGSVTDPALRTKARQRAGGGGRAAASLAGSPDQLREVLSSFGTMDRARDVDEGEKNIFKTRRYRYASFFNRVRDAIAREWHPEVVHAARDPYGNVYGSKNRTTRLMIRLAKDGSLVRASLEHSCGVGYLDEEAIRAVRTAQPFTHPPDELINADTGYIEFMFAFTLEIDGRRRIFRSSRR